MDPNPATPKFAIASLANITPFLWPFVLLSLGVALTPVSPISWSYSTWLLFIIPLIITVFAPIHTFSGPLRFAYLEYASKIGFWAVYLLKGIITNFHSIPTLALPALFFLPVLPLLFFVVFPAIPVIWHYVAFHYRRRLKAVTDSVTNTIAELDLAIDRAKQAIALAHTFESQALHAVSTTRCTPLVAVSRHSTDFATAVFDDPKGRCRLIQSPGTLGADLAGKVLDTEKQMVIVEDASRRIRTLSEQAVAVATEGDMVPGEELAENAARLLEVVVKQVDELRSTAEEARCTWVEFRRRLNKVTASASTTTATLDLTVNQARRAATLAHTYENQALIFVSTTRRTAYQTLALHDADFFEATPPVERAREAISKEAEKVRDLGGSFVEKMMSVEASLGQVESGAEAVRALLEQAVTAAVDGDVANGETLTTNAAESLKTVVQKNMEVCAISDQVRYAWAELSVECWTIP